MRVLTVIFTFTMAFGIPLPSGYGKLSSTRVPQDCQENNNGFQVNVTRSSEGDIIQSYCRQCTELCVYANAVRLRCDLQETPCICHCPQGQTFRTDTVKCVETFAFVETDPECINKDTISDGVFHIITSEDSSVEHEQQPELPVSITVTNTTDFNQTDDENINIFSTSSLESIPSNSKNCEVKVSEFLDGKKWNSSLPVKPNVSQDNTGDIQEQVTWNFDLDEDKIPSVRWTGSEIEFKQLSGLLVRLRVLCVDFETEICAMVKVEGIKTYTIFLPPRSTTAPPKTARSTMADDNAVYQFDRVTPEPTPTTPVYNPLTPTTAGNKTTDILTGLVPDEELEVIVTGVCVGVAIIMCLWMTCFAIEKRVQTTRTRGEGKTSSSRTYTYAVSSCRKNLMENYDMPMIKVAKPKDDDDSSGSDGHRKKKQSDSSNSSFRSNNDADAEADETTSPSSSEQRAETGSSPENVPKKKSSFKQPPSYLDLPTKPGKEGFGTWRPVSKQGSLSPSCGTGEVKLKGILKMTPQHFKPVPILKNSILKKPKTDAHIKGHSPTFSRRFVRTGSKRNQLNQGGDYLELQTLNGASPQGTSPTKNEGRHISSFKHAVLKARKTRFKADELDDCAKHNDEKKHVVITCEVHHVDETPNGHRETEDNEENVKCSELEPLTKETYAANQLKRNCFEMRWEDTESAQTAQTASV